MAEQWISLAMSGFEFYLLVEFYRTLWSKRPCGTRRKVLVLSAYVLLSLLAALTWTSSWAIYLGMLSCMAVGCLYQVSVLWNLVSALLFVLLLCIGEIVSIGLLLGWSPQPSPLPDMNAPFLLFGTIFSKLIALVLIKLIALRRGRISSSRDLYPSPLSLLIALYSCVMGYFMISYLRVSPSPAVLLTVGVLFTFIVLSNIFLMDLLNKMAQSRRNEEQLSLAQTSLEREVRCYQNLLSAQNEMNRKMHDMRNQLTAVMGLLRAGQGEEAYGLLEDLTKAARITTGMEGTGNPAIDAIIAANLPKMREKQIHYTQNLALPESCAIPYQDLAIVVGNIFDNAICACGEVPEESSRYISLKLRQMQAYLCIQMENSALEVQQPEEAEEAGPPDPFHGFGLQNIQLIAQKHGGYVNIVREESVYSILIMLLNQGGGGSAS